MKDVVTPEWLLKHLNDPDLIILESRLLKPKSVTTSPVYPNTHIPNALHFDLEGAFADTISELPHMIASEKKFTKSARNLGLNRHNKIVVYDQFGIYSSPRVWWMFKAMGHDDIAVLDGGLPAWVALNNPTANILSSKRSTGDFEARLQNNWIADAQEVLIRSAKHGHLILDARSSGRFFGTEPEPRAGLKSGHIPNSKNLPFPDVLENGRFKPSTELESIFNDLVIKKQHVTLTCGSGVTASIIALAAYNAGFKNLSVYDGSWCEWGQLSDFPVVKQD